MIKTIIDGVDPNKYIYKTNLKFGDEFSQSLLNRVVKNPVDSLVFRNNYDNPMKNPFDTYNKIGKDNSRELIRRARQVKERFPTEPDFISFTQYFLTHADSEEFLNLTPQFLKEITPGEPVPIFQISHSGHLLPPHKGHKRKSSLFMLLQGNNEETRWYRETSPFDIIHSTRIPDLDKVEHVVSAQIEPGYWYVFNHLEWHSVHKFSSGIRMNIGLDFDSITAPELIKIIEDAGNR
jgi:hypothetical protein